MVILVELSSVTLMQRSRNGSLLLVSGSIVNFIWGSMLLMCCVNESTSCLPVLVKVSST